LWRVLVQNLAKMSCALSTRIESLKEVYVLFEGSALFLCRLIRKPSHGGMKELPSCAAKFLPIRLLVSGVRSEC